MLNAINSSASGITTYIGSYPNHCTINGHAGGGGGFAMTSSRSTALEKLWSRSAIVKMIRPRVKLDVIFRYISIYEIKRTSSKTMFPAVI